MTELCLEGSSPLLDGHHRDTRGDHPREQVCVCACVRVCVYKGPSLTAASESPSWRAVSHCFLSARSLRDVHYSCALKARSSNGTEGVVPVAVVGGLSGASLVLAPTGVVSHGVEPERGWACRRGRRRECGSVGGDAVGYRSARLSGGRVE